MTPPFDVEHELQQHGRALRGLAGELLGDANAADDAVQEVWSHAMRAGPRHAQSTGGWLRTVLLHVVSRWRRGERRRAHHETLGARQRGFVAEDHAVVCAREEVAQQLLAAVRELEPMYRDVVWARFFDGMAPREIAAVRGEPLATVKSRLQRALAMLRERLGGSRGDGERWRAAFATAFGWRDEAVVVRAGGAGGGGVAIGAIAFTGVLAMKKFVVAVVVLAAVLGGWVLWGGDPALPAPGDGGGEPMADATVHAAPLPSAQAQQPSSATSDAARIAAPPPHDPNTASLELLVLWHDGTPAADLAVRCRPRPLDTEPWLRVSRTGEDGVARFDDLPPGPANALTGRGAYVDVELAAGTTQQATVTLERGLDVHGRVVDIDGRPFPGATVWLSIVRDSDDSEPVATSGGDGTFVVRGAREQHVVSATARGFATAKVAFVRKAELVLTMRPAPGVLTGIVVDAKGQPVAGARLLVGIAMGDRREAGVHQRMLGLITSRDHWPLRFLRADANGRFRCEGLPPWKWPVWVGAPGHALWWGEVQVLDVGETSITVQLMLGATLRARVVDAAGAVVADAKIGAFPRLPSMDVRLTFGIDKLVSPPRWWRAGTTTVVDGVHEMRQLTPGNYTLSAGSDTKRVQQEVELRDGETFVWDAVLEASGGQLLHGVLVDDGGNALGNWTLLVGRRSEVEQPTSIRVSEQGTFRRSSIAPGRQQMVARLPYGMLGSDVDLGEFDTASCPLRLVVPRAQIPTSRIRGRVVMPVGTPATSCYVWAMLAGTRRAVRVPCDDQGRYEAGPVLAGKYWMKVESLAFGEVAMRNVDVVDGQDTDAGTFAPPTPGTLVVTVVDAKGQRLPDAWVDARALAAHELEAHFEQRDGIARGNLVAGRWRLTTRDRSTIAAMDVEVRAGETTDVRFTVPTGVPFTVRVPAAARSLDHPTLRWRAANGDLLRESTSDREIPLGKDLSLSAPAGSYTLEVLDAAGAKASTTFDLRATDPPMVIELPLPGR